MSVCSSVVFFDFFDSIQTTKLQQFISFAILSYSYHVLLNNSILRRRHPWWNSLSPPPMSKKTAGKSVFYMVRQFAIFAFAPSPQLSHACFNFNTLRSPPFSVFYGWLFPLFWFWLWFKNGIIVGLSENSQPSQSVFHFSTTKATARVFHIELESHDPPCQVVMVALEVGGQGGDKRQRQWHRGGWDHHCCTSNVQHRTCRQPRFMRSHVAHFGGGVIGGGSTCKWTWQSLLHNGGWCGGIARQWTMLVRRHTSTIPIVRLVGAVARHQRSRVDRGRKSLGLGGMVQAWVGQKLVNVTFYEFFRYWRGHATSTSHHYRHTILWLY